MDGVKNEQKIERISRKNTHFVIALLSYLGCYFFRGFLNKLLATFFGGIIIALTEDLGLYL